MLANLALLRRGKRNRGPRIERLESRLHLCVTGFVEGEFVEFCVPELPDPAPVDVARAADAVNQFANDLYQHFEAESGNIFLSPLSVTTALAMTYAGAGGQTAAEMAEVLHFGAEPGIHDSFRALLEYRAGDDTPFELELANAQWPGVNLAVRDEFVQRIRDDYDGESQSLDYSRPDEAKDVINAWVTEKTRGTIRDLIKQLSPQTVMVLTNAVYFNASWAIPFDPWVTMPLPFSRDDGNVVMVPTMYQEATFRYTEHDGFQILELPYQDGAASMVVLLPGEELASHDLPPDMLSHVNQWLEGAPEPQDVDVRLPKFKTTVSSSLQAVLGDMGMPSAFDERADFSAMTAEAVFIDQVLHKAFVEVNEQGTEAGAATSVLFVVCFAAGTPVLTADGEKPIEQLRPGDQVLARDEHNLEGAVEPKLVEETFQRSAEILRLHVGGQILRTTSEHPFFVQGRGWTNASDLAAGDLLAAANGDWIALEKTEATGEVQSVYNLRVADHHTYFVGSKAWGFALWAHNRCGGPAPPEFTADRPFHFLIRDNATSATLFMGRVSDPLLEEAATTLVPRVDGAQARPGDADGDDDVDFADFLVLAENFGRDDDPTSADGDFNGDHVVDFADFLILQQNFDQPPPISSPAAAPDKETAWLESARYSDLVMLDQNLLELDSPTSLQRAI